MGNAMRKMRLEWKQRKRKPMPDVWHVYGVAVTGEEMSFHEQTEEKANYVADRINKRGGSVKVKRLVFDGPAAAWLDPDV